MQAVAKAKTAHAGPSKFAFRRRTPGAASTAPLPAQTQPPPVSSAATRPIDSTPEMLTLQNIQGRYADASDLSTVTTSQSLAISSITDCFVDLNNCPTPLSTVFVRDLTRSVIMLPKVSGSVMVHHAARSTIVLSCHQASARFSGLSSTRHEPSALILLDAKPPVTAPDTRHVRLPTCARRPVQTCDRTVPTPRVHTAAVGVPSVVSDFRIG